MTGIQTFSLCPLNVFHVNGRGTVVTGCVKEGFLRVGEELYLIDSFGTKHKITCVGIEMFRKLVDQCEAGDNVGILLKDIFILKKEIEHGAWLQKGGDTDNSIGKSTFFEKALKTLDEILQIPFYPFLLLIDLIDLLFPDKAKNIIILGTKRSGKSTLWKGLGGIQSVRSNTRLEPIRSFVITRKDGSKVTISETYDIGGEEENVKDYSRIIKEEPFIYYLVNSNEVSDPTTMKQVRSNLVKIEKVLKEKGIEKFGFKYILTCFYDFKAKNPNSSEYDLYRLFLSGMERRKGIGVIGSKLTDDKIDKIMMVAELDENKAKLLGEDYIDIIKNEIGG